MPANPPRTSVPNTFFPGLSHAEPVHTCPIHPRPMGQTVKWFRPASSEPADSAFPAPSMETMIKALFIFPGSLCLLPDPGASPDAPPAYRTVSSVSFFPHDHHFHV